MKKIFLPAMPANFSATMSEILLMAAAAWLISSAALHPPLSSLSIGITLVRTAGIFRAALKYADRFFSHKIIFKFLDELREKLFRQATEVLPVKSGKIGEGSLLHELTVTADMLKDFLPRVILPISTAALITIFLTVLLKSPIPAIIFFADLILSKFFKFDKADDSNYREKILDFCAARDELKIFGSTPAVKQMNQVSKNFAVAQEKIFSRQTNFDTAIFVLNTAGIFFILHELFGAVDKIFFAVWVFILIATLEIYSAIPSAVRSFVKIKSLQGEKVESFSSSKNFAVEFANVSFSYDEKNFVLKDFNLKIGCGEKIAIVGESGAGKTTLLYLMTKLFKPDAGKISVSGKISAATHENFIFSRSIRFNFEMFCENISDEEIFAALKICRLENFDIDSEIGEDASFLSGGERTRLQIALAIAKNPDILILDEPTAGLNKNLAESLIDEIIFDSTKKNRTLIIITHDLKVIGDKWQVKSENSYRLSLTTYHFPT